MPRFLHAVFATRGDVEPGLRRVEKMVPVDYVLTGMFDADQVIRYTSAFHLPSLGVSLAGSNTLDPMYMVVPSGVNVKTEPIPQRRGGTKYVVDQRENDVAGILFQPGGLYRDEALISGQLGTPLTDELSIRIFRLFYKELLRDFVRVNAYYVGPEALGLLRGGLRLTDDVEAARICDLALGEIMPVKPTAPGVWGDDSPEISRMRSGPKE